MTLGFLHIKSCLEIALIVCLLIGCKDKGTISISQDDSTSSESDASITLKAINLTDISASSSDVKTMTLTWTSASESIGVTYTVCEADTSQTNDCNELISVIDSLTATVSVDSLVDALTTDYFILASAGASLSLSSEANVTSDEVTKMIGYLKASDTDANDQFGKQLSLSSDGSTLAVGAPNQDDGGAVYIFSNGDNGLTQTGYIQSSNITAGDLFGTSVALNSAGSLLAVGARKEDSNLQGITTDEPDISNNSSSDSGAVYLFSNNNGSWTQTAYIKASNAENGDNFGTGVALDATGTTLAVGAVFEDNGAEGVTNRDADNTFISGTPVDEDTKNRSGAVYLFDYDDSSWEQTAYIKASNSGPSDYFGNSLSLSADGNTLSVVAYTEDGSGTGVTMGSESEITGDTGSSNSGAVYLFSNDSGWTQTAYIKASNTGAGDWFGVSAALSGDGHTLAVGAKREDSGASGITIGTDVADETNSSTNSGAVYLFAYDGNIETWDQTAYIKASNPSSSDYFGQSVALNYDGSILVVGADEEDSSLTGLLNDNSEIDDLSNANNSGAAYLFSYNDGEWDQTAYIKASNSSEDHHFGYNIAISGDGDILAVGAYGEDNSATGVASDVSETDGDTGEASASGAVYLY